MTQFRPGRWRVAPRALQRARTPPDCVRLPESGMIRYRIAVPADSLLSLFSEGHTMQDLSTYSLAKLRALEVQVIDELKSRHFLSVSKAREQILHIAQSAGISVKDLMSGKSVPRAKSAPAGAKFRNPDDASQEWSGRGRQPNWIKAWTASGKSIEDTKI